MFRTKLYEEPFEEAVWAIHAVREVEIDVARRRGQGVEDWIHEMLRARAPQPPPTVEEWVAPLGPSGVVHAAVAQGASWQPFCRWRRQGSKAAFQGEVRRTARLAEARSWGRTFCTDCVKLLPASMVYQIRN